MLRLCGFAGSNYHNKVKLALIEKQLPFEDANNLLVTDETLDSVLRINGDFCNL